MAAAHVFVASLDRPELDADDRHHLERVLRLRPGEEITVGDGAGGCRTCRFGPTLEPLDDVRREPRAEPVITVGFALVKGGRPEWIVQKLTEVGVDKVVPFVAARSVVRWEGIRVERGVARLRKVAREAAMQSRRLWLPEVEWVETFSAAGRGPGTAVADRDGDPPSLTATTVLVGPEGGWAPEERGAGLPVVALGPNVLRSETAALVAGVLWSAMRARLVAGGDVALVRDQVARRPGLGR